MDLAFLRKPYLVEQTAQQIERGMALQKALDEGQRPTSPVSLLEPAASASPSPMMPEDLTPELLDLARQLLALSARS